MDGRLRKWEGGGSASGGAFSKRAKVRTGVLQGLVLGPRLFLVCVND